MIIGLFTDTSAPEVNGVATVVDVTQRELTRRGHEVHTFTPSYPGDSNTSQELHRLPSLPFIFYPGMRVALPYRRHTLPLVRGLDLIHSHTPGPVGLLALWAARRYHIPHVHHYHTHYTEYRYYLPWPVRPSRRAVERMVSGLCNRCQAVIAPSHQIKRELESYGVQTPIYPLSFGPDKEAFSRKIQWDVREHYNLPSEDLLLYVGRLGTEKNLDFLLRAFKQVVSGRASARLFIAGIGPERPELERQAADLGVAPYVIFTGRLEQEHLIDLYKQALFVFASKTETQGIVLVEAMMAGSPVVAIGRMGVLDIVRPGETGILVEENEEEFAQACLRLLDDKAERERMGRAAKEWAASHSAQASVDRLLTIYHAVRGRESGAVTSLAEAASESAPSLRPSRQDQEPV